MNDRPRWLIPLATVAARAVIAVTAPLVSRNAGNGTTALNPLGEHFVATLTPGESDSPIAIVSTSTGSKTGYCDAAVHGRARIG